MITFAIPMAPKSRCDYWDHAMDNFEVTLRSMVRQTDKSFTVVIAKTKGDGKLPSFVNDFAEKEVCTIIITEVEDSGEFSSDKDNKTLSMLEIHKALGNKYFLRTDWDDIFHRDLVKWVVNNENEYGFIITDGYFYRPGDHSVIPCSPWFMYCGSCHLVNYSDDELKNGVHHPDKFKFHHQHIHEYRHKIGRPLQTIPISVGLYAVTGKNISTPKHERILADKEWFKMSDELKEEYNL